LKLVPSVVLFLHCVWPMLLSQVATARPSLLLEVTLEANKAHSSARAGNSCSSSNSSSNSSSSVARGLSGPNRVALLKGLARAAGVGRLAVALGQVKLAQPHATYVSPATAAATATAGGEDVTMLLVGWHYRFQQLTFRVRLCVVWWGWAWGKGGSEA
jgi:hypothetical protein